MNVADAPGKGLGVFSAVDAPGRQARSCAATLGQEFHPAHGCVAVRSSRLGSVSTRAWCKRQFMGRRLRQCALDRAHQCGSLDTVSLLRAHGGQPGSSFLQRRCCNYVQTRSSTTLFVVCVCGLIWLALGLERCVLALATACFVSVPIYVSLRTRKRVDFFIVGAQKAGTSALWTYLAEHPAVFLSKEKELHFFDDDARFLLTNPVAIIIRVLQYHTCFGGLRHGAKVIGEATPIYCWWRGALERIAAYNPKAKIIMLMRDPVSRAYSHWNMNGQQGTNPLAFVDALEIERSGAKLRQPPEPRIRDYIHHLLAPPCRGRSQRRRAFSTSSSATWIVADTLVRSLSCEGGFPRTNSCSSSMSSSVLTSRKESMPSATFSGWIR